MFDTLHKLGSRLAGEQSSQGIKQATLQGQTPKDG